MKPKRLKHKGITFFKYPDGYYRNGKTTLHRFKYEQKFGVVLPCFHIHHIDGNKLNNHLNNLLLLSPQEHIMLHKILRREKIFENQLKFEFSNRMN